MREKSKLEKMENISDMDVKLKRHYILGIGRSGTTLVVDILNRNKNVLATPESVFAQFFYSSFKNKEQFKEKHIHAILDFIKNYEKQFPFIDWDFDYAFFDSLEYPLNIDYNNLLNLIHSKFIPPNVKNEEINWVVDKNPGNSLFGEKLLNISPDSKAIILVRDYRAYLLSHKKKQYWRSSNTAINAKRWQLFYAELLKLNKRNPEKTLIVKYEDLVSNNRAVILSIFDFLEIPFMDEVLVPKINSLTDEKIDKKYGYLSTVHLSALKSKISALNKPVYNNHLEEWKSKLDSQDIAVCDAICAKIGSEFAYETYGESLKSTFLLKYSISYFKGVISVLKPRILFTLPYKLKLWRLKQVVNKVTRK